MVHENPRASSASPSSQGPAPLHAPIKQRRSQITFNHLVETGLRLACERDLAEIPVAEIAKEAGYSVGAFYARFPNKDVFHQALVQRYADDSMEGTEAFFREAPDDGLIEAYLGRQIDRLWAYRYFWLASLRRSIEDPVFWEPLRRVVRRVGDLLVARAEQRVGRALTEDEETSIRFAVQVTNGAINNTMINRPGPLTVDDPAFRHRLIKAFHAIAGWDRLA